MKRISTNLLYGIVVLGSILPTIAQATDYSYLYCMESPSTQDARKGEKWASWGEAAALESGKTSPYQWLTDSKSGGHANFDYVFIWGNGKDNHFYPTNEKGANFAYESNLDPIGSKLNQVTNLFKTVKEHCQAFVNICTANYGKNFDLVAAKNDKNGTTVPISLYENGQSVDCPFERQVQEFGKIGKGDWGFSEVKHTTWVFGRSAPDGSSLPNWDRFHPPIYWLQCKTSEGGYAFHLFTPNDNGSYQGEGRTYWPGKPSEDGQQAWQSLLDGDIGKPFCTEGWK